MEEHDRLDSGQSADPDMIPLPRLTAPQDELLRTAFHELRRRRAPVPESHLIAACGRAVEVSEELERLSAAGRVGRDVEGNVTGALGLTLNRTTHELWLDESLWHSWCVIDALGILGATGVTGWLRSSVAGGDRAIRVAMADGQVVGGYTECVVFIPRYEPGASVIKAWCPAVSLFPEQDEARAWAAAHGVQGDVVPVDVAAAAARRRWHERLRPAVEDGHP